ncbi:hypothetical protein POTOM_018132 [Populus tomentosa]|uniref:Uncharacterized protein n=1 Tax=Populus tomentosa TaxID=118781 RepID=A0A8X8A5L0_POPTO|nr:hypothetical protein POTOM_018132 [Populus tomentosa]
MTSVREFVPQDNRGRSLLSLRRVSTVGHDIVSKDFSNDLDQLDVAPGLTPDFVQVRNVRDGNMLYDLSLLSYTVLTFATSSDVLSAQRDAMVEQELCPAQLNIPIAADDSLLTNTSHTVLSSLNASPTANNGDAQECGNWTKLGSERSYDLSVDYTVVFQCLDKKADRELPSGECDANTQGLSLSLSSIRPSKLNDTNFAEAYESECLDSKSGFSKEPHDDSKVSRESYLCPLPIPSILSKGGGKPSHNLPGNATNVQNTGLLGPLTGYSTILNSGGARPPRLSDTVNESDTGDEANGDNNLGASLFNFRRSNEEFGDCGVGNISSESYRPEYRQMKAKRLLLLDEKYTLETKGLLENNQVSGKNVGDSAEGSMQPDGDRQAPKKIDTKYMFSKQLECSRFGASGAVEIKWKRRRIKRRDGEWSLRFL